MLRILTIAILAQTTAPTNKPLEFEVAWVKPTTSQGNGSSIRISNGSLSVKGATLKQLIGMCFDLHNFQISGGPGWIGTERFDIEAKAEVQPAAPTGKPLTDQQRKEFEDRFKERFLSFLTERFQLQARESTKEMPLYELVQAKGGAKLISVSRENTGDIGHVGVGTHMTRGTMTATSVTMESLANSLSGAVDRPVIDKTGLPGKFDCKLEWTPEGQLSPQIPGNPQIATTPVEVTGPSLFTALQEQLGLKLEPRKGPARVLVIDRAEKPTAN